MVRSHVRRSKSKPSPALASFATQPFQLLPYFRSRNMESRTAAATALQHICQLVPAWTPTQAVSPDTTPSSPPEYPHFSVQSLLESGNLLLSSSGQEFTKSMTLGTPEEIARSRKEAMSRLGLDFLNDSDDDDWGKELVEEAVDVAMADDEQRPAQSDDHEMETEAPVDPVTARSDGECSRMSAEPTSTPAVASLSCHAPFAAPQHDPPPVPLQGPLEPDAVNTEDADAPGLSVRERNRLKRKRKGTIGAYMNAPPSAPPTK
jgi:TATA-binding protein-associated factor